MKIVIILMLSCGLAYADPTDSAMDSYKQHNSYYKSGKDLSNKLANPLLSDTPMQTQSGESFSSKIQCSGDKPIIKLGLNYSDGGEGYITVKQDTTLNGNLDYTYNTPSISGVCHNSGIMSCTPGTMSNCVYYDWTVVGGKVTMKQVAHSQSIGECFCTNNGCGQTISLPHLQSTAGTVALVLMEHDKRFTLSPSISSEPDMVAYVGQNQGNCSDNDYGGSANPRNYYSPTTLPDATSYIASQAADSNSWYSSMGKLLDVEYEQGKNMGRYNSNSCVENNALVFLSCPPGYEKIPGTAKCQKVLWNEATHSKSNRVCARYGPDYTTCEEWDIYKTTLEILGDNLIHEGVAYSREHYVEFYLASANGTKRHWMAKVAVNNNTTLDVPIHTADDVYGCSNGTVFVTSPSERTPGNKIIAIEMDAYEGGHSGSISIGARVYEVLVPETDKIAYTVSTGTCTGIPSSCQLQYEKACMPDGTECIDLIKNGIKQNPSKSKLCYQTNSLIDVILVSSDGKNITIANDSINEVIGSGWFYVEKQYACQKSNSSNNFTDLMKQTNSSMGTMGYSPESGTMYYKDLLTGEDVYTSGLFPITNCPTPTCTVTVPEVITKAFPDGASDNTTTTIDHDTQNQLPKYIRMCEPNDSGTQWTCPFDPEAGEQVQNSGQCTCDLSDMGVNSAYAQAVMTVLEQAVKSKMCVKRK